MMALLKVVLDTNGLLRSISRKSPYAHILTRLRENGFELYLTNDILLEYEEKITENFFARNRRIDCWSFISHA